MVKECVVYIYSLLQTDVKQGGGSVAVSVMFGVFAAGTDVRNLALLNPGEPHWAARAPVSNKYQQKSLAPHNNTIKSWTLPPFPPRHWSLVLKGFWLLLSQFHGSSPGLFPSCAVTAVCQQATTADTDGSPGLWWLPYVTSLFWAGAFFLNVFLSISHLFLCFAL